LNVGANNKIKILTLHPKKEWMGMINYNNTFFLWNYKEKILIKSFNCNTLDDYKNIDIKELIFYDRHSLPDDRITFIKSGKIMPLKSNIIFASSLKLFFYDYITDGIKQITEK
jgi:hypothetical protein